MVALTVRLLWAVVILCGISYADSVQFYTSSSSWAAAAGRTVITPDITSVGIGGIIENGISDFFIGLLLPGGIPGVTQADFLPVVNTPTLVWITEFAVACESDCPYTFEMTLFFPKPTTAFAIEFAPGSSYEGFLGVVFNSPQSQFTFDLFDNPQLAHCCGSSAEGRFFITEFSYTTPVPEPSAMLLVSTGLAGMLGVIRLKLLC
jgi:hypothetical protein